MISYNLWGQEGIIKAGDELSAMTGNSYNNMSPQITHPPRTCKELIPYRWVLGM